MKIETFAKNFLSEDQVHALVKGMIDFGFPEDTVHEMADAMISSIASEESKYDVEVDFLKPYPHRLRMASSVRKSWRRLSSKEKEEVVLSIPKYCRYLRHTGYSPMMPTTYLNKTNRRWADFLPTKEEEKYIKIAKYLLAYFHQKWQWKGYKEPDIDILADKVEALHHVHGAINHEDIELVARWVIDSWRTNEDLYKHINPLSVLNAKKWHGRVSMARAFASSTVSAQ